MVFAGTKNGRELISHLGDQGHCIIASSMSEYGASLLQNSENIICLTGQKSMEDIEGIIDRYKIDLVIDSTHPYAKEISENIKDACKNKKIETIRFERKSSIPADLGYHFETMGDVCNYLKFREGNILFTTGVNEVLNTVKKIDLSRIYVRVLPIEYSLKKIEESGLKEGHVIIKKPPFTLDENIKHISDFNIKYLVTKDSGAEGNTSEKIEAVELTNTQLLVIDRPKIEYDLVLFNKDEVSDYLNCYRGVLSHG